MVEDPVWRGALRSVLGMERWGQPQVPGCDTARQRRIVGDFPFKSSRWGEEDGSWV